MTFGEKLKEARKEAGYSQLELAEKLGVSRSAVAKWEADGGMPDVMNLKSIGDLLDVSVDALLAEDDKLSFREIRKPIVLENYTKGGKARDRKDAACLAHYPEAESIYPLIRRKKLGIKEILLDFFTSWGISQLADYANDMDGYYFVEQKSRQYLVRVSHDFLQESELTQKVDPKKFTVGNNIFRKSTYRLK